jgi:hypothetical protein
MLNFAVSDEIDAENPTLVDELIAAVAAGDVKQRLHVLQRVTDLFVAGSRRYSGEQVALFDDVLQRLCRRYRGQGARAARRPAGGPRQGAAPARPHARLRRRRRRGRAGADPFAAID